MNDVKTAGRVRIACEGGAAHVDVEGYHGHPFDRDDVPLLRALELHFGPVLVDDFRGMSWAFMGKAPTLVELDREIVKPRNRATLWQWQPYGALTQRIRAQQAGAAEAFAKLEAGDVIEGYSYVIVHCPSLDDEEG